MNTTNDISNPFFTLDEIIRLKGKKQEEIRASKERINQTVGMLFHSKETDHTDLSLMKYFNSGITLFNGIVTCFKFIQRIRRYFKR